MQIEIVKYKVTGTTPLLTDNPVGLLEGKSVSKTKTAKKDDHVAIAKRAAYVSESTGHYYIPSAAFRSCILGGTKHEKIGKISGASVAMSGVFTADKETTLLDPKTWRPLKGYKVNSCRGVNPSNHSGIVVVRPEFEPWGAIVTLKVDRDIIGDLDVLDKFFSQGGIRNGVGAFRIENRGEYGQFTVERMNGKE